MALAKRAKRAGLARQFLVAKSLQNRANALYLIVLRQIMNLGEDEADRVEPAFTEFENQLFQINVFSSVPERVDQPRSDLFPMDGKVGASRKRRNGKRN